MPYISGIDARQHTRKTASGEAELRAGSRSAHESSGNRVASQKVTGPIRRHFISHCLDAIRQLGCRLLLMHGQLGGSMEIEVEGLHLGINRVDFRARWSCPRYGLGLRGGASKQEHTTGQRG